MATVFVIILVFLGDRLLSSVFQSINLSSEFRYSRLYDGRGQSDVILLGNSRGHTLYQPAIRRLTESSTINLSYNALPTSVARAVVEDYYDLYPPPKKLVFEISMLVKTERNVINEFKLYTPQSTRLKEVVKGNSHRTAIACAISNMYLFNSDLFHRSLYYLEKDDADWILSKSISKNLVNTVDNIQAMEFEITYDRMQDLKELVKKAISSETNVELILAPYFPAYAEKITNLDDFINQVEEGTGLKVHDYSRLLNKEELFSDYLHLNKVGSEVFVKKLHEDAIL